MSMEIEISSNPVLFDAPELAEGSMLTADQLLRIYRAASEKSLRDSGLFADATIVTGTSRFMDEAHGKASWGDGYCSGSIGTLAVLSEKQQRAFDATDQVGHDAMWNELQSHPAEIDAD